jgi:hypothetical protein
MHCVLILPQRGKGLPTAQLLRRWGFAVSAAVRAEEPDQEPRPEGGRPHPAAPDSGQNDHHCLDEK